MIAGWVFSVRRRSASGPSKHSFDSEKPNASSASASYGTPVALVATMSGGLSPTGTVTFFEGPTNLGSATLSGSAAILMVSSLALGAHAITAVYGGDSNNMSATSGSAGVTIVQDAPTVSLSSSSASVSSGAAVTLVAALSGGTSPSGSVTFYDGASSLGTSTVSGSAAILTVTSLSAGVHAITAVYGGDANNATAPSGTTSVWFAASGPSYPASNRKPVGALSNRA